MEMVAVEMKQTPKEKKFVNNEADSEGEEVYEKDVKEITDMMKSFTPYMFEAENDDVSSINSSSSEVEDGDENDSKTNLEKSSRV